MTRSTLVLHVGPHLTHTGTVQGRWAWFRSGFDETLLFQDLLKHTPPNHPDHPLLQDALRISQNFLSSINEEITPRRQSMMVKKGEVSKKPSADLRPEVQLPEFLCDSGHAGLLCARCDWFLC